ncbi:atos homolog protein A isoform X2 [Conger conger]|nr:atos homolog protein A isoform X2 [Conger conger]
MRSEVMLLWRNNIPAMIEVMLLPDCCYSDEGPSTDGTDISDPALKQDALLLERWTLQPVPRQSGDRFIEEKTLLLAVRSYVFFSQLSAWLSASHGIVPRNILYRISAADEELVWDFSQAPAEHTFPVPNVSHSVALNVRVQSLPRQPNYPVLKCSIHASLSLFGQKGYEQEEQPAQGCEFTDAGQHRSQDPAFTSPGQTPLLYGVINSKKCQLPEALPPSKAARWLYSRLNSSQDVRPSEGHTTSGSSGEGSKTTAPELPVRAFKSLSLVDPLVMSTPGPRLPVGEPSPLIGSLLQERQEVIARIAQHLNYCDPSAPHIPDSLFSGPEEQAPKSPWFPKKDAGLHTKCRDPLSSSPERAGSPLEKGQESRSGSSPSDTPLGLRSRTRANGELRSSPKPAACRKLLLPDPTDSSRISEALQDISRLIQDTFQQSQNRCTDLLQCTCATCKEGSVLKPPSRPEQGSHAPCHHTSDSLVTSNGSGPQICTDSRIKETDGTQQDHSLRPRSQGPTKLEDSTAESEPKTSHGLQNAKKDICDSSPVSCQGQNGLEISDRSLLEEAKSSRAQSQPSTQYSHLQDENLDPSASSTSTSLLQRDPKVCPETAQIGTILRATGQVPPKPCNIWKKQNRHSIDGSATNAFHPCTGLPLLSSPVPQRRTQTGYFDLDTSLTRCKGAPWAASRRVCVDREGDGHESRQQLFSTSAPPASLSLLGNFEECVLNHRLEPLGTVEGFMAEVGASGTFCPSHMTQPVEVSFYSVSDDNAPSPYMGVINLESLGKRGYRIPPSGTIQVTLFNPNKTVVKMFVVVYDLREMPASHQTFLRQRTFSVPVRRDTNGHTNRKSLPLSQERILRYLIHLRFQSSKSGKIYLHSDIRLLFSRKSMEVDSGAAYELQSFTETPADPPFSPRC